VPFDSGSALGESVIAHFAIPCIEVRQSHMPERETYQPGTL
jgi:hypothetical protein